MPGALQQALGEVDVPAASPVSGAQAGAPANVFSGKVAAMFRAGAAGLPFDTEVDALDQLADMAEFAERHGTPAS